LDRDRLINLLPEEYLPEPEFKAFPIFAAVLIILTVLFVYVRFQADVRAEASIKQELASAQQANLARINQVNEFLEIQANARFIRSYFAVIPNMVLQAPDYWEIYNEVERLLPEDTWVKNLVFRTRPKKWPTIAIDFLSKGYSFHGPLATYDAFTGTPDDPTRFTHLYMGGYQRSIIGGSPTASFQITMEIKYPTAEDTGE
jgi:hypothetical protein